MKRDSSICPKCGSRNIYAGEKGFNTGRAIAGGLLTGNLFVSAVAGSIGSKTIKLTCLYCGHEFGIGEGGVEPPKENEFTRIEKSMFLKMRGKRLICISVDAVKSFVEKGLTPNALNMEEDLIHKMLCYHQKSIR